MSTPTEQACAKALIRALLTIRPLPEDDHGTRERCIYLLEQVGGALLLGFEPPRLRHPSRRERFIELTVRHD